jgi:2-oxoglutarate dehydrogenase E2 component (dihydrolipoamide succinyltransferase)
MAVDITVPNIGESVTEVTVSSWTKEEGAYVEMDEVVCEIESDKATFELTAEEAGTLHRSVSEGDTVAVGDKVGTVDPEGVPATSDDSSKDDESSGPSDEASDKTAPSPEPAATESQTYASQEPSPAAKKILDESGIKPENVQGTGKDGRITKADAQKAVQEKESEKPKKPEEPKSEEKQEQPKAAAEPEAPPAPKPSGGSREVQTERMSNLRKTIAKKLVSAKNETAMLTTFNEVDMSNLMAIRKQYKDTFKEKYDVNLGFMSFFAKAVCEAITEFPEVNAKILEEDQTIQYHNYVDLGIAVSTPRGLVVPNIRNAESMSFSEIEKSVIYYGKKARDNQISIDEMQGGTFTITNGGIFGSMLSTPILNAPQSAILGMHNIVERPVAINGQVEIRPIMYVALSYDHRLVDGKESVSFLYRIKELIEDPSRLLLGV